MLAGFPGSHRTQGSTLVLRKKERGSRSHSWGKQPSALWNLDSEGSIHQREGMAQRHLQLDSVCTDYLFFFFSNKSKALSNYNTERKVVKS